MKRLKSLIIKYKKTSAFVVLVVAFAGYKVVTSLGGGEQAQYITAIAEGGDIIVSVNGAGQVSASNRVDVASEVSGDIVYVSVKLGDEVKKGQTLVGVDSREAERAVENAELSLENARISYEKAQKQDKEQSESSSISDLNQAYNDGYTTVANAMIDIPDIIENVGNIFYDPSHSAYFGDTNARTIAGETAIAYKYEAGRAFDQSKKDYEIAFKNYKNIKTADREALIALIQNIHDMVETLHSSLIGVYNTIDYIKARIPSENVPGQIAADKSELSSYISKLNSHLNNLSNALMDIEDAKDSATEATLDLKSAELALSKAEDDLRLAKEDLANHRVSAPFDGVIGKVDVEAGDKISTNGTVATIITNDKIAEVSLNEVDVSKVKAGQEAAIAFDAIDGLSVKGVVTEVDLLGQVSQGVVSYTVKIAFDADDDRVKTGMSLSADIVSETKQAAVRVPNSAVKSQGGMNYVETLKSDGSVARVPVRVGLSNDEFTEITSGLNEGDSFISKTTTLTAANAAATQQAPSLFGSGRGTGSGVRIQAR